ncbi:MAG: hypothetical protein ACRDG8_01290 [Actinomycetota bacterium]
MPVRDRAPIVAIAAVLLIGLAVVGAFVWAFLAGDEEPRAERSPAVAANTATTYRLRATDDADPSEAVPEGVHFDLSTTLTIDVSDVGAGMTAEVRLGDVDARFDGQAGPVAIAEPQLLRLDEQARPDNVVMVAADSTGTFFYFLDLLFPVTSPEPASEGDPWPIAFEAGFPTATGSARYEGTGEHVGSEEVAGIQTAEVRNDLSFEYDFTMLAPEVAQLSGLGSVSSGTVRVTGTGAMTVTGWIDPSTERVLRTEVEGHYDVVFRYRDFDRAEVELADNDFPSKGTFTASLELVP